MSAGISGHWTNYFETQGYTISMGRNFTDNENLARKRVAVLGAKVAQELKTSPKQMLNNELLIAGVPYKVVGIMESEGSSGWRSPDDKVYVPLLTASDRLYGRKTVNSIGVSISNDQNIEEAMVAIEQVLRRQHDIGPGADNDFRINDWSQYSDLRKQATAIFTSLLIGIAGISLLVGGIGVMNIMLVSVTERTREIGLRKALGATHKAIMMQFIVEAVLLCVLGGLVGVILGASIFYAFAYVQEWPFFIPFDAIVGSITFSAAVGLFFGIWPARRAAKLDPALSLRYE
jgi:putative ABC transport system permease protein